MESQFANLSDRAQLLSKILNESVYTNAQNVTDPLEKGLNEAERLLLELRARQGALVIVGNGGSAAVASHAITDFTNVGRLRACVLHESSLITCMANDFGYENAYARVLKQFLTPGDILVCISSSGRSMNIRLAAEVANRLGNKVVTLSGFASDNPLRQLGEHNFWINSNDYGLVEIGHLFMLHHLSDRLGWFDKLHMYKEQNSIPEIAA